MTERMLQSPLREYFELIHYNIGKGRSVSTKGRFDIINLMYGVCQPLKLAILVIRDSPDIVYTMLPQNTAGFLRYATFIFISKIFGRKIVVGVTGGAFDRFWGNSPRLFQWFIKLVLQSIDIFIVLAHSLKAQFGGLVPDHRFRVVYLGINRDSFQTQKDDDAVVRILFMGYLTQAKGALDLLKAVPYVTARCPGVLFEMAGDRVSVERNITFIENPQDNASEFDRLMQKDVSQQHVKLLGVITGMSKVDAFQRADVFVLPSYSEAFPVVVLEAMAAGLPVVASPVGALPEVFTEDNVLFVQPGDIRGLAQAILRLCTDPALRSRMGENNGKLILERFTLSHFAEQKRRVFDELLRSSSP